MSLALMFLVLMAIQAGREAFLDWHVVGVALGLLVAAVSGKPVSGWGARSPGDGVSGQSGCK